MTRNYRPRRIVLRNGRAVTLRAVVESDADRIVAAFERLSADTRYRRFMFHKKALNHAIVERGVHPRPGAEFVFVATAKSAADVDIVGAAQYVPAQEGDTSACEFAITVADDWHGSGLATVLLDSLVRRARRDGYAHMEGLVLADNAPMLALARKLHFKVMPAPEGNNVVRVRRELASPARPAHSEVGTIGADAHCNDKERSTAMPTEQLERANIATKANVYFDGKCVSHGVTLADGTKKSVGVILPSTLTFNTGAPEVMETTAGACEVLLPGSSEWQRCVAGESFNVPGNASFQIRVSGEPYHYICHFG